MVSVLVWSHVDSFLVINIVEVPTLHVSTAHNMYDAFQIHCERRHKEIQAIMSIFYEISDKVKKLSAHLRNEE